MNILAVFQLVQILVILALSETQAIEIINHRDVRAKDIPKKFDARIKWPYCSSIKTVFDRGSCDLSWNFAVASAMSDRACIATKGAFNQILSVQDLMECFKPSRQPSLDPCKKIYLNDFMRSAIKDAFLFVENQGIATADCKPLETRSYPSRKDCRKRCANSRSNYNKAKIFSLKTLKAPSDQNKEMTIKAEIMRNGPVAVLMNDYMDTYKNAAPGTIIQFQRFAPKAHAVKIIGWDTKDITTHLGTKKVEVWLVANSLGRRWCDQGFCYATYATVDLKHLYIGVPKVPPDLLKTRETLSTDNGSNKMMASLKVLQFFVISSIVMHYA